MKALRKTIASTAIALLALTSSSCLLIPEIEKRTVELAVSGSAKVTFNSVGTLNNHDDLQAIDIRDHVDIAQALDDAGVSVENVQSISLAGVSYRTVRLDPTADRQIVGGTVTFQRQGGAEVPLVTSVTENVNTVTSYKTATISAAGVAEIDDLLQELLAELQGGPPANTAFSYHVTGQSVPGAVGTDFAWEIKLDIHMVGTIDVEVPN